MAFYMPSELSGLLECLDVNKLPLQWTFVRRTGEYKLIMSWTLPGKKNLLVKGKKKTRNLSIKRLSEEKLLPSPKSEEINNDESDEDANEDSDEETLASSSSGLQNNQSDSPEVEKSNREPPETSDPGCERFVTTHKKEKAAKPKQVDPRAKRTFDKWHKKITEKKRESLGFDGGRKRPQNKPFEN